MVKVFKLNKSIALIYAFPLPFMAVITVSKNDLSSLVGKELTDNEISDAISKLGESVEKIDSNEIEIELLPNRADFCSVEGIARALKFFLNLQNFKEYKAKESNIKITVDENLKDIRPFVVCAVVKNVEMRDYFVKSLMDMQEKLHLTIGRKRKKVSIGVHDFSKVQSPFIYKAVLPKSIKFVPLAKTQLMDMEEILQKHEKGIEYAEILKGFEMYPIILDKNEDVLSFPPIINGSLTAVTEETRELFIEITGTDLNAISYALNILTTSLADRNAEIYSVEVVYKDKILKTPNYSLKEMKLNVKNVSETLGIKLSNEEIIKSLRKMGFFAESKDKEILVKIPPYRNDILHEYDLIEDVAIGFGYGNIRSSLPECMTFGEKRNLEKLSEKIRNVFVGLGFNEVMSLTLSSEKEQFEKMNLITLEELKELDKLREDKKFKKFLLLGEDEIRNFIEIKEETEKLNESVLKKSIEDKKFQELNEKNLKKLKKLSENDFNLLMKLKQYERTTIKNPISEEHTCLRVSLIPSLLNILKANKHRELPQKIFEIGEVVLNAKNVRKIGFAVIHSKANFTEAKSIIECLLRELNIKFTIKEKINASFINGRCAKIFVNGKEIGIFGEISPKVIENFELGYPIIVGEMSVDK